MLSHPLMFVGLVVLVLTVSGVVVAVMREARIFAGFREIAPEVKTIANQISGEVFRDGHDLVVSGSYHDVPTMVRFSNHENTPAVTLGARIPSVCQFTVTPRQIAGKGLTGNVRLRNRVLEERFIARSSNPIDLELLLTPDVSANFLESLCCSRNTILEVSHGKLDLLEMVFPEQLARHVLDHLAVIRGFANALAKMPGSDQVKVLPFEQQRSSRVFKAAVAAGVVVACLSVIAATRDYDKPLARRANGSGLVHGVPSNDAMFIYGMDQWRAVKPEEIDREFAAWLHESGKQPESRIKFKSVDDTSSSGVAYLLAKDDGSRRVVVLVNHRAVFDAVFPRIAGIARVPVTSFPKLKWDQWQAPKQQPDGDAILIVRDTADPRSAELLFFPDGKIATGVPQDFSTIDLVDEGY